MSKVNVWGLQRPEDPIHEIKATSANGEEFVFKMRRLGSIGIAVATDLCEEATIKYHGDPINGIAPVPFPPIDGKVLIPSRSALWNLAQLAAMQVGEPEEKYTVEELFAVMALREEVFNSIFVQATQLGLLGPRKEENPTAGEQATTEK